MKSIFLLLICLGAATPLMDLAGAQGAVLVSPSTVTPGRQSLLSDTQTLPLVGFAGNPAVVIEGDPAITLTLELSVASVNSVDVAVVASGSAQLGVDYSLSTQNVTFAPGQMSAQILVTGLPDANPEDAEFLDLELVQPHNAHLGQGANHRVHVRDIGSVLSVVAGSLTSDDFDRCGGLTGLWSVANPMGDGFAQVVGIASGQALLQMQVPAGIEHQAWNSINSPQVLQPLGAGDFEAELAFIDTPSPGEVYGFLVKQDDQNWSRFDFYNAGGTVYAYAGRTVNGRTRQRLNTPMAGTGSGLWMRVARVGTHYLMRVSTDGVLWTTLTNYTHNFAPVELGPYIGNFGTNPAADMEVDYVFDVASPIVPEDSGLQSNPALDVVVTGSGSTIAVPAGPNYACGTDVTLTATPDAGWVFDSWQGDISSTQASIVVPMDGPVDVTAVFVSTSNPPILSNIQVVPSYGDAVVTWDTNQPADSLVNFGTTAAYGNQVADGAFVANHQLVIPGLLPQTQYHFQVVSENAGGDSTQGTDLTFTTGAAPIPALVSDDFNGCGGLGPAWTFLDSPAGDGAFGLQGAGTSDAQLGISVPAGSSHQAWGTIDCPRVVQTVADTDFEVEVKFDSEISLGYQLQGILVEQDNTHWLRFDLYGTGSGTRFFAGATNGGGTVQKADGALAASAPYYLRVERTGNQWEFEFSPDGVAWTLLTSFQHSMVVDHVGPYAGNEGASGPASAPAFTALCDYVFDTAAPIAPEDGAVLAGGPYTLTAQVPGGGGSIQVAPASPDYVCGEQVTLTAVPDMGFHFVGWTGDASGTTNPLVFSMQSDVDLDAVFAVDSMDPILSNVVVVPGDTDALITWDTDQPSDSVVNFGTTAGYGSQVQDGALVTQHQLLIPGLTEQTQYHFQVVSTNGNGGFAQTLDDAFTTEATPISVLISDDFNGCGGLGPAWTFYDSPSFDSSYALVGAGTNDAQLSISVPAGTEHRAWNTLTCPRVMQTIDDSNFVAEIKFDSEMPAAYQTQGFLVQEDDINWLTFRVYGTGAGARYYVGSTDAGGTHFKGDGPLVGSAPYYLRVSRSANQFAFEHSQDGAAWTTLKTFSRSMIVNQVGPYAGNTDLAGGASSPAFTALCDYVFDTAAPVVPEDGASGGGGPYTLNTSVSGTGGVIQVSPAAPSYNCGDSVTLSAVADNGYQFTGWGGQASGIANPLVLSVSGDTSITAQFTMDLGEPIITNVNVVPGANSALVTWNTVDPADSQVEFGPTMGLGSTAGSPTQETSHAIELINLIPETLYYFQISSTDGDGDTTLQPLASFTTASAGSLVSDDFHRPNLDLGVWTFVDPHGVAGLTLTGSGTADAYLELTVPSGVAYEPWITNGAARISQPVANEDFAFQAKFENAITEVNTSTGLFVEADANNWIRADYYFDGTNLNVLSVRFVGGAPANLQYTQVQSGPWTDDSPLYMRVSRQGNFWVTEYGFDGVAWLPVGSFTSSMLPTQVGIMCGSAAGSAKPQTVRVDWFESVVLPILNEDPVGGADTTAPFVYDLDAVPLSENAVQISWATEEPSTGRVEWGTTAAYGMAPAYSGGLALRHTITLLGLTADTDYHFQVVAEDAALNSVSSADQSVETFDYPGANAPVIQFWYGLPDPLTGAHNLSFGQLGNGQNQFNVLGRVTDADQDRIALEVSLEYRWNGGSWSPLALGDDRTISYDPWRLVNEGDFNLELFVDQLVGVPLVGGVHRSALELRATDNGGHSTLSTVLIDYTPNVTWLDTLTVSWANVANNLAGRIEQAVQVVDGMWEVFNDPNMGYVLRPNPNELGYDRLITIGEGHGADGWDNYEALVPVTVNSFDPQGYTTGTSSYGMGFGMRWTGHTEGGPFAQPNHGLYPLGGLYLYRWFQNSQRWELWINENEGILPQPGNPISLGVTYWYRMRCEDAPGGGTTYSLKVWEDGMTEPAGWTFQHTTNPGDPKKGSLLLVAHHVNVSFGDVVVTHLP